MSGFEYVDLILFRIMYKNRNCSIIKCGYISNDEIVMIALNGKVKDTNSTFLLNSIGTRELSNDYFNIVYIIICIPELYYLIQYFKQNFLRFTIKL